MFPPRLDPRFSTTQFRSIARLKIVILQPDSRRKKEKIDHDHDNSFRKVPFRTRMNGLTILLDSPRLDPKRLTEICAVCSSEGGSRARMYS